MGRLLAGEMRRVFELAFRWRMPLPPVFRWLPRLPAAVRWLRQLPVEDVELVPLPQRCLARAEGQCRR